METGNKTKMNTIEISCKTAMTKVEIFVNQRSIANDVDCTSVQAEFKDELPVTVEVFFEPFKLKPIVRFNNFMLNYWLANIVLYDHKLQFEIGKNFYLDYKEKDIQGRLGHVQSQGEIPDHVYDKYIGIKNLHPELVQEIYELLK
jgi:hypothetical protein